MCSVSFLKHPRGFILAMNRDESRKRVPSKRVHFEERQVFPCDGDSLSTWIGANAYGNLFCLLNNYTCQAYQKEQEKLKEKTKKTKQISRGHIIPSLLKRKHLHEIQSKMRSETFLNAFQPFHLIYISLFEKQIHYWQWQGPSYKGEECLYKNIPFESFFKSSSSWNEKEVLKYRKEIFCHFKKRIQNNQATLEESQKHIRIFHSYREADKESYGISMERKEAKTLSYTEMLIPIDKSRLCFSHFNQPPSFQSLKDLSPKNSAKDSPRDSAKNSARDSAKDSAKNSAKDSTMKGETFSMHLQREAPFRQETLPIPTKNHS